MNEPLANLTVISASTGLGLLKLQSVYAGTVKTVFESSSMGCTSLVADDLAIACYCEAYPTQAGEVADAA
ncbi:hypothetical protein [Pseudoxanthomonas winnipegensis]|uniref:Uncharacterized protein n=1 Tax=Pseudoxanthomonas winnipegensis TaxID=2480810 RepID=A0A4Q8LZM7_9GAMM|nr:hypothetical protein [Pseudoxanthomonas winnipegensis]RZZ90626.1 hypothetical protein EA663_02405 [Pseudoxanthomonas winnipegensis]TAA37219.1 hypothetical protein EA656_00635 [Pseudoxanthomonas winnipegensis]